MTRRRSFPWLVMLVGGCLVGSMAFVVARPTGGTAAPMDFFPTTVPPRSTTATAPEQTTAPGPTTLPGPSAVDQPTTTSAPIVREQLVIHGVGDVNFDPVYLDVFAEEGYEVAFEGLDDIFLSDDLTVINLECPPTDVGTQLDKDYSFHCDPAALPVARDNGVDVANLANNHGQDRGVEGLLDSIVNLRRSGIQPVGAGVDLDEATTPALFEIGGWSVAVLGMGGVVPGDAWLATDDHPGMASGDDTDQMVAAVSAAAELADIVVVTIHWGRELVIEPDQEDRERAQAMVEAGADIIFGHHSHRLGEMELIDGVPVFWSLGNFIWPRLSDPGATSGVARVVVDHDGTVEACVIPAFIERSGRPDLRGDPTCEGER